MSIRNLNRSFWREDVKMMTCDRFIIGQAVFQLGVLFFILYGFQVLPTEWTTFEDVSGIFCESSTNISVFVLIFLRREMSRAEGSETPSCSIPLCTANCSMKSTPEDSEMKRMSSHIFSATTSTLVSGFLPPEYKLCWSVLESHSPKRNV